MFSENYMAYLERAAKDAFAAAGMALEARNYAMGGTASAWEIGTCIEEIFGLDIDILSWDYGMVRNAKMSIAIPRIVVVVSQY